MHDPSGCVDNSTLNWTRSFILLGAIPGATLFWKNHKQSGYNSYFFKLQVKLIQSQNQILKGAEFSEDRCLTKFLSVVTEQKESHYIYYCERAAGWERLSLALQRRGVWYRLLWDEWCQWLSARLHSILFLICLLCSAARLVNSC